MRLTEKVFLIGGSAYGYSAIGDCNVYMIDCGGSLAIIDTGGGKGVVPMLNNVKKMGFNLNDIELAFISHSHYDHIGGNKKFKEYTGCKIVAHEAEKRDIEELSEMSLYSMALENGLSFEPTEVDIVVKGGESIKIGNYSIEILHTPGHTPGGISFLIDDGESKSLFPGDTASAQGRLGFINGPGFFLSDWKASIKLMISQKPDTMFPGHGTFVLSDAIDHLVQYDEKLNAPWVNIVTSVG
jgi:glyoxylase-like metal-dependent hydrolase (beta-lactamase superfamily II)